MQLHKYICTYIFTCTHMPLSVSVFMFPMIKQLPIRNRWARRTSRYFFLSCHRTFLQPISCHHHPWEFQYFNRKQYTGIPLINFHHTVLFQLPTEHNSKLFLSITQKLFPLHLIKFSFFYQISQSCPIDLTSKCLDFSLLFCSGSLSFSFQLMPPSFKLFKACFFKVITYSFDLLKLDHYVFNWIESECGTMLMLFIVCPLCAQSCVGHFEIIGLIILQESPKK